MSPLLGNLSSFLKTSSRSVAVQMDTAFIPFLQMGPCCSFSRIWWQKAIAHEGGKKLWIQNVVQLENTLNTSWKRLIKHCSTLKLLYNFMIWPGIFNCFLFSRMTSLSLHKILNILNQKQHPVKDSLSLKTPPIIPHFRMNELQYLQFMRATVEALKSSSVQQLP